jgi:hypothetical protein
VSRFLGKLLPWMAFAFVGLGIWFLEEMLHEYAARPVRLIDSVPPAVLIGLGALVLLAGIYERRLSMRIAQDDERMRELGEIEKEPPRPPGQKPSRADVLLKARDFLPEEPPEGWSRPMATRSPVRWLFETKTERCGLTLERHKVMSIVKVFIVGKGAHEPMSDARCAAILEHVRNVGEFIETDADPEYPEARTWIARPTGERPRWRVPKSIPAPRERVLSPHLVAARKYLPQKLPQGWSVPVAIGDDHGTEWKDGAWMIGTSDARFIVVCLVTSKGRVKLSVTFFGADAVEVSEGAAVDMLRHFRGILEFAQTEAVSGGEVPTRTYLGELAPEGGTRVLLN